MRSLTSIPTLVESPFIIVKIGDFTFGNVEKIKSGNTLDVTFPEYMKSVEIVKVNGEVNTYTIQLLYPITKGRDPNLIDYVFSSVSATRKLTISYGDWNSPAFIYKEEECLITNVRSNLNFNTPSITYTINCVSDAKGLQSVNYSFGPRTDQPSNIILSLFDNAEYGTALREIFTGMKSRSTILSAGLIPGGDKVVDIPAKVSCNLWDYLTYLVGFMVPAEMPDNAITSSAFYRISVIDDNMNDLGGSYFKITRVSKEDNVVLDEDDTNSTITMGAYELDVGFPQNDFITDFSLNNDEEWSILYNTSNAVEARNYSYKITNDGRLEKNYSPTLTRISSWEGTTAADKSWWTAVTGFPLQATITLKGLVRPTMLMSYVKLNVVFYGQRHISSGYYIIQKETDVVNDQGYKTTLNLLRIKSDPLTKYDVTIRNNKTDPATGFNLDQNQGSNLNYLGGNLLFNSDESNTGYNNRRIRNSTIFTTGENQSMNRNSNRIFQLTGDNSNKNPSYSERAGIQASNLNPQTRTNTTEFGKVNNSSALDSFYNVDTIDGNQQKKLGGK